MSAPAAESSWSRTSTLLNNQRHRAVLAVFAVIVLGHWVEHIAQAIQIYVLGWPVAEANGVLGLAYPWLVTSEWMHYGYAIVMLVGLVTLRLGFTGRSGQWWRTSMWIQAWHHVEHLLLLVQALTGAYLLGSAKPTSIIQLVIPRVELHLFYNTIVFVPMVVAMVLHLRPNASERAQVTCSCAVAVTTDGR